MGQPLDEPGGQFRLSHLLLRRCDIIAHATPDRTPTVRVDEQARGPWIVVARLPYATRIQDESPPGARQRYFRLADDPARLHRAVRAHGEERRYVGVPDQAERPFKMIEARRRRRHVQQVLPDMAARA